MLFISGAEKVKSFFRFSVKLVLFSICFTFPAYAREIYSYDNFTEKIIPHTSKWFSSFLTLNKKILLFDGTQLFFLNEGKIFPQPELLSQLGHIERIAVNEDNQLYGIRRIKSKWEVFVKNKSNLQTIPLPESFSFKDSENLAISINKSKIVVLKGKDIFTRDGNSWICKKLKGYSSLPEELPVPKVYSPPLIALISGNSIFLGYNKGEFGGAVSNFDPLSGKEKFIYKGDPVTSLAAGKSNVLWFTTSAGGNIDVKSQLYKFQNNVLTLVSTHMGELYKEQDRKNRIGWKYKKIASTNWKYSPTIFCKIRFNSNDQLMLLTESEGVFQITEDKISQLFKPWGKRRESLLDFATTEKGELVLLETNGIVIIKE